jgi:hypothetical protein
MIGLHRGTTQNSAFLAIKIDLFSNVYQELLENEDGYVRDILKSLDGQDISSDSKKTFTDRFVKNINTRVLTNEQGKVLVIYSILDQSILIVARNEDALYKAYLAHNTAIPKNNF